MSSCPSLYSGALAVLAPSFYEGFGLTALEAMACGTVPIVSDAASLPEIVGDVGLLIDPHDIDSIGGAHIKGADGQRLARGAIGGGAAAGGGLPLDRHGALRVGLLQRRAELRGGAMKSGVGICGWATHRVAPTDRAVEGEL